MKARLIERVLIGLLAFIAIGMALHTPFIVGFGTAFPAYDLVIKAWKELLMGVAFVLLVAAALHRSKAHELLSDRLMQLCLVYAGLHLVMISVFQNGFQTAGAGLLIDLRYVLYFVLVYGTLLLLPRYRRLLLRAFVVGAMMIIGFGFLQITVLPKDILSYIGYSKATIAPYLTVDENPALIRISSTLRGPNPLGAYAVIVLSFLTSLAATWKLGRKAKWFIAIFAILTFVVLYASYSRSAFIGLAAALGVIVFAVSPAAARKRLFILSGCAVIAIVSALFVFRAHPIVQNIALHDNPSTGAEVDSNAGHAESLVDGAVAFIRQPFGAGIGSTGSASLFSDKPIIIENQYLLIGHETGWLGLIIFGWLYVEIMRRLWRRRTSAMALGVFGSGIGLAVIGLLLPVWTDDTVSIIWWGLAATAIAAPVAVNKKRKNRHA